MVAPVQNLKLVDTRVEVLDQVEIVGVEAEVDEGHLVEELELAFVLFLNELKAVALYQRVVDTRSEGEVRYEL